MAAGGLKIFAAGVGAAATGVAALGTAAVKSYADYEQLVGGIETLFGAGGASVEEYADKVGKSVSDAQDEYNALMEAQTLAIDNANQAYKTAGLSASEYMETVTGFAASLKQSTANEVEAAEAANQAVIDMSDNANKMGTSMESIQNAYQGFAKQNYTMLDNLKLGYGGTKEEMQRLLADAEELTGIKYDISNLNDVYSAIHVIQTELGITGTTAKEASTTISGSLNALKASWSNLVVGIADDTQDFDVLVDNFVESAATAADNLLPRIEIAIKGIGTLIEKLLPAIADRIPAIINDVLPDLIQSGISAISSLVDGIKQNLPMLMESAEEIFGQLITAFLEILPGLAEVAIQLIETLAQGILDNLPMLIEVVTEVIDMILGELPGLIEGILPQLIDAGIDLLVALIEGISQALPELVVSITNVITQIVTVLLEHIPDILEAGMQLLLALVDAIPDVIDALIEVLPGIIDAIFDALIEGIPVLFEGAIQLLNALVDAIPEIIIFLTEALPDIIEAIVEGLIAGIPMLIDGAVQLLLAIVDAIPEIIEALVEALPDIIEAIVTALIGGIPLLIEAAIQLFLALVDAIPEIIDALTEALPDIIDAIIEGLTPLGEELSTLLTGIWDGICEWISDIGTSLKESFISWWDGVVAFFTESIPAFFENIGTWLSELPDKIMYWFGYILTSIIAWNADMITWVAENIPVLIDNIVTFFSELPGKIREWLLDVIAKIVEWNVDMTTKATEAGSDFIEGVISFIKDLPSRIWTWLLRTITKAASFIVKFKEKATDAGKGFFDNIVSAIEELPEKMAEIGGQIVSGIWNGISSGWSNLVTNVKGLANSLFTGAKEALDIHSPSKKFRWLGEMCVAGMDEPISDYDPYDTLDRTLKAGAKGVTASFAIAGIGQNSGQTGAFDYGQMGEAMENAMHGVGVYLEGRPVGRIIAPYVDETMGRIRERRT